MQECFLRALAVEQYWLPDKSAHYSPLRWILAIMLELEKRTGSSELTRIEFGLWGHTTNPAYDVNEVVDHILDLRERRKKAPAKRPFDRKEIEERGNAFEILPGHAENKEPFYIQYVEDIESCAQGIVDGSLPIGVYTRRVGAYATYNSGNIYFDSSKITVE